MTSIPFRDSVYTEHGLIETLPAAWTRLFKQTSDEWYHSEKNFQWFAMFRDGLPVEVRPEYPWNW